MSDQFSASDIMLIKKEMHQKTCAQIAYLIDKPVKDISNMIKQFTGTAPAVGKLKALKPKRETRKKTDLKATVLKKEKGVGFRQEQEQRIARRGRWEPQFQTKQVDYSQLITVRIDHKTVIYAKPGENIEAVRQRYLKRLQASKSRTVLGIKTA